MVCLNKLKCETFFHFTADTTKLANSAIDEELLKMGRRLDPLKLASSTNDIKSTSIIKIKLGSISWNRGKVTGLSHLQRVGDVVITKKRSNLEIKTTVDCVDVKISSVMNPRLGNFPSTTDIPVSYTVFYMKIHFRFLVGVGFSDPPTVNVTMVEYQDGNLKFDVNRIAKGLLQLLTQKQFTYHRVRFKEKLRNSLQQNINRNMANYRLPVLLRPLAYIFGVADMMHLLN